MKTIENKILLDSIFKEKREIDINYTIRQYKKYIGHNIKNLRIIRKSLEAIYGKFTKKYCNPEKCLCKEKWVSTCCSRCASAKGYYNTDIEKEFNRIMKIKEKYWINDKVGYLSKKGCNIPSHLRSYTCSTFLCTYMEYKIDRKYKMTDFYENFIFNLEIWRKMKKYMENIIEYKTKLQLYNSLLIYHLLLRILN